MARVINISSIYETHDVLVSLCKELEEKNVIKLRNIEGSVCIVFSDFEELKSKAFETLEQMNWDKYEQHITFNTLINRVSHCLNLA